MTSARLGARCRRSLRLDPRCTDPLAHHLLMLEQVFRQAAQLRRHALPRRLPALPALAARRQSHVTTLHGRLDIPDLVPLYREFRRDAGRLDLRRAARAAAARELAGDRATTACRRTAYRFRPEPGDYLAFLGRISPEKRVDRAIEIAKRAGMPLKIAAKVDAADRDYFEAEIGPLARRIRWSSSSARSARPRRTTSSAGPYALLFPIDWPEPFGLVMIEAMACGTPVIAYRHGLGARGDRRTAAAASSCRTWTRPSQAVEMVGRLDRGRLPRRSSRSASRRADGQRLPASVRARWPPRWRSMGMAKRSCVPPRTSTSWRPRRGVDDRTRVLKHDDTFAVFDR